jgi:signal transduction histidine kinase
MLGGTGLGLSLVKHIVLIHEGTMKVKSVLGEGSTFSITLPVYPE